VSCTKRLNRSICHLGCGFMWAEGSTGSIVFVQVVLMSPHGRAHWRQLPNMIEPSACGVDAALCQITLTTCL